MNKKDKIKEYKKKEKLDKKEKKNKKKNTKLRKTIKIILLVLLFVALIFAGILVGKVYSIMKNAKLDMSTLVIQYENSVAKDMNGETIAVFSGDENRKIITLSEMSPYIPKAFIAIEDERFEEHNGIDIKRTAAATIKWGLSKIGIGSASYGGSTITQQLVKNLTKEDERSSIRKIKEMARAYYIEQELSKNQILELYLNLIFLGGKAYGVEVASTYYFNKSASELTLAESAFLAGINSSPNIYEPFAEGENKEEEMELIKNRVKTVLAKMLDLEKITQEEYDTAVAETEAGLAFEEGQISANVYSYHTEAAVNQVIDDLMEIHPDWSREYTNLYVKSGGLTIYTTQNSVIQNIMEEEFAKEKNIRYSRETTDEEGNYVTSQSAMVVIDHTNGYVVGTVGGLGTKTTSFGLNRATQSTRQTGSSMKPLAVLVPGIDTGIITAASVYDDVPTSFAGGTYSPTNYSDIYSGLLTTRYAIENSRNIPMVKAIQEIGVGTSIEYLKKMGITTIDEEKDNYLGLALGGLTNGISPLEMAAAYASIANDGVYIEPTFYTKVVDSEGNTILEAKQETRTVMSKSAAYVIKEILTQPVKSGTATNCSISGMSVAAKTGSTDNLKDRWLCGFSPYYTASCWYGYDEPEVIYSSGNPAGSIWSSVMRQVHNGFPSKYFSSTRPDGVVAVTVCKCSGLLPTEDCKNDPRGDQTYTEYFVRGTAPTEYCNCHVKVAICNDSGLLANDGCCQNVTEKVFITRPDVETNTSWQRALDAQYTLTIKDHCTIHLKPEESEDSDNEEKPDEPDDEEKPDDSGNSDGNNTGNNIGNDIGNDIGNNIGNNIENNIGNNTENNIIDNNTVTGNETSNNTIE